MRRITTAALIITALLAGPAFAQLPNLSAVPRDVLGGGSLVAIEAQHKFVDDVVCALNRIDPSFGHLRKNPGQTQVHGHAEDSALYRLTGTSVDFFSARTSNPTVGWIVDQPRYSEADWLPPHNCGTDGTLPTGGPLEMPPPIDLSAILAKLDALSNQIHALSLQIADAGEAAENARAVAQSARDRIEDTLTAVDLARQQINRPPIYTGGILGIPVTLRPTVHPANPVK